MENLDQLIKSVFQACHSHVLLVSHLTIDTLWFVVSLAKKSAFDSLLILNLFHSTATSVA